jgi:hypothetical protein
MISVLLVHNAYQHPGGEDAVVAAERALLSPPSRTEHM